MGEWGKIGENSKNKIGIYNFINSKIIGIENIIDQNVQSGNKDWMMGSWRRISKDKQLEKLNRGKQRIKFILDIGKEYNTYNEKESNTEKEKWEAKKVIYDKTLREFVLGQHLRFKELTQEEKKINIFKDLKNLIKRKIESSFHILSVKNNSKLYKSKFFISKSNGKYFIKYKQIEDNNEKNKGKKLKRISIKIDDDKKEEEEKEVEGDGN